MASSTALNEALACVALGYISTVERPTLIRFYNVIKKGSSDWDQIIKNCEISQRNHSTYQEEFKDVKGKMNPWIESSYKTAKEIEKVLNLKGHLNEYIFSRVERNLNHKAYWIKQKAISGIKKHAKLIFDQNVGIMGTATPDKINISDIAIIKKNSKIYDELEKLIQNTDVSQAALKRNLKSNKNLLTLHEYRNLLITGWKNKEIFSVSLKAIKPATTVPVKIINAPTGLITKSKQDKLALFLSLLVRIAKKGGNTFQEFKDKIDEMIQIKPVVFTAADRLHVHFEFLYENEDERKFHIFTNFGEGNAIHFVPEGSSSASGEGGITITYFNTLSQRFPELKNFFEKLSKIRLDFFIEACKEFDVDYHDILDKLGSKSMKSNAYHSSFYLAKDYGKLIDVMLGVNNIYRIGQISVKTVKVGNQIQKVYYAKIKNKIKEVDEDGRPIYDEKGKAIERMVIRDDFNDIKDGQPGKTYPIRIQSSLSHISALKKFFEDYTNYLSQQRGSMGRFLAISEKSKGDMKSKKEKIKENIDKLVRRQKDPKLQKMARKTAIQNVLKETEFAKPTFKKSYALLTNAEFGFLFSKHQKMVEEILKKQILLSLYSAASGRGYIILDGKKFSANDYYEKNTSSPPPILKIGR